MSDKAATTSRYWIAINGSSCALSAIPWQNPASAQQVRALCEELELLKSDPALAAWAQVDHYGAVGRACWYECVFRAQEFPWLLFRDDPRRPVHMRGSVWVLDELWRSDGWRARIIERYLRLTRYSGSSRQQIERDIDRLDDRLRDLRRHGWRRWVAHGKRSAVRARDLVGWAERQPFVPPARTGAFVWRDGKRVYVSAPPTLEEI